MMTPEEIKAERKDLEDEYERVRGELNIVRTKMKNLGQRCRHPNRFKHFSYDGSFDMHCPDCKAL